MKINCLLFMVMMQLLVYPAIAQSTDPQQKPGNKRNTALKQIYHEKDPVKKEQLYHSWLQHFPQQKSDSAEKVQYDHARYAVAVAYAEVNNVAKAMQYATGFETTVWKAQGWSNVALALAKNGHIKEAVALYKNALAHAYSCVISNNYDPAVQIAAAGYPGYARALSNIYIDQQNYQEALPVLKQWYERPEYADAAAYEAYAAVLGHLGMDRESFEVLDKAAKSGLATASMKNELKQLFKKLKGSEAGYEEYLAAVNKALVEKIRNDVAKTMINMPAPNFSLKNVEGKTVSLAALKGKTVVLDFWATWCGPCKASFPIMKTAVERYKNDSSVQFLFIHTFENDSNATTVAKKYITDNRYPFEVLMDLKNNQGINAVAEGYQLGGIPTKIVIDSNGNIRFSVTGFSGGEDAAVAEVAAMIELSKKAL